MARFEREPPKRLFQGAEFGRLLAMIGMFVVLVMMIRVAGNPGVWQWLVSKPAEQNVVVKEDDRVQQPAPDKVSRETVAPSAGSSPDAGPAAGKNVETPHKKTPAATGPTDENDFEAFASARDYDAVTDGKEFIQAEDMPAYQRLVRWVINQPYQRLLDREAQKNPTYGQFIAAPQDFRQPGKIFDFVVHLRQVNKFDDKLTFDDEVDPHPPATLYEMWGTTDESRGRFLHFVVYDPPAGLPMGRNVQEDVRFVGYFFRIQAYEPGRAQLNSRLLLAPSFVGRIDWRPSGPARLVESSEMPWMILLGGGIAAVMAIWLGFVFLGKGKRNVAQLATDLPPPPTITVEEWLDQVESNEADDSDSNGRFSTGDDELDYDAPR
jgi:hypothetical protein